MLNKKNRLTTKEVASVFKGAHKVSLGGITLLFKVNNKKTNRFAVSVSSKVFNKAVDRNKTKRMVYSIVSEKKVNQNSNDFVFIIKKRFSKTDKKDFVEKINTLLTKTT